MRYLFRNPHYLWGVHPILVGLPFAVTLALSAFLPGPNVLAISLIVAGFH